MSKVRNDVIASLRKNLLGPRNGPHEIIDFIPNEEYVVGCLIPKDTINPHEERVQAIEAKPQDHDEEIDMEGEVDWIEPQDVSGLLLDPRMKIKSFGISFEVQTEEEIQFNICLTWARYNPIEKSGKSRKFKRFPFCKILQKCKLPLGESILFNSNGVLAKSIVSVLDSSQKKFHVVVYFVNDTDLHDKERPSTEDMIFQPQIRIAEIGYGKILPIYIKNVEAEDGNFELLYQNRQAFGRGHNCAAIWKEIDPEKNNEMQEDHSNPFNWDEMECVVRFVDDKALISSFTPPRLRSEFIPAVLLEQVERVPEPAFLDQFRLGSNLSFSAEALSETTDENELESIIIVLTDAYEKWIDETEKEIANLQTDLKKPAQDNIAAARESLFRIKKGIQILVTDERARIAFSFMNKAMNLQRVWRVKNTLHWFPFQLAFILQSIPEIVDPAQYSKERRMCDLLWFPTGGGKTEAYLGLAGFVIAFRRLLGSEHYGTTVLSRYTLRLLTLQQFRRALSLITACEFLRTTKWTPPHCKEAIDWGGMRISVGLWVGNTVTPRTGLDAIEKLEDAHNEHLVEPAQVLNCPCCQSILAITTNSLNKTGSIVRWHVKFHGPYSGLPKPSVISTSRIVVYKIDVHDLGNGYHLLTMNVGFKGSAPTLRTIHNWWTAQVLPAFSTMELQSTNVVRPGYFAIDWRGRGVKNDFEIRCLNPECELSQVDWTETYPVANEEYIPEQNPAFVIGRNAEVSKGMPIPAYTIDQQIYNKCATMIIATVDKFARLPYEPRASAIFGNIDRFDECWGYFRKSSPPFDRSYHDSRAPDVEAKRFTPPGLIIQDELHLIDGPLGSIIGIYETSIDELSRWNEIPAKYVASSATVRKAKDQVQAVFDRDLKIFPPSGICIEDNFFSHYPEGIPAESTKPGRIYLGICTTGASMQAITRNIWAVVMQEAQSLAKTYGKNNQNVDGYWTCVGYFNAIRELAAARTLLRQDIPERLEVLASPNHRKIPPTGIIELSGNVNSSEIPGLLIRLESGPPNDVDALLATSMFGVGVDVDRLGLMIVHGQPKTTSSYIQATGRVGRALPGLVISLYRPARPRDLAHYEFFTGYHLALLSYTEPISVYPMSMGARERALGPVAVGLIRNADRILNMPVHPNWAIEYRGRLDKSGSRRMNQHKNDPEIKKLSDLFENRSQIQPSMRKPNPKIVLRETDRCMQKWESLAKLRPNDLLYSQQTYYNPADRPVVLGTPAHKTQQIDTVFENAPQSMRDVEGTARFGVEL